MWTLRISRRLVTTLRSRGDHNTLTEQIVGVLKQAQVGVPVAEVIRKAGISEQTFYRWKAKYVGLEVDQVRQMAQLQEENLRLKKLVAELTLDKAMLQDVLSKKW